MNALDLLLCAALLGGGLVWRREAVAAPPAELIDNLELLDAMPMLLPDADPEAP